MEVYKVLPSHFALAALKNRRLKLCMVDSSNDPYEFLPFNFLDQACRKRFHSNRDDFALEHGLLCFSGVWNEPKMWESCAQQSGGACLAVEITRGENVTYVKEFEDLDCNALTNNNFETLVCTKLIKWQHEQEIRVAKPYNRHPPDSNSECIYFHPFDPGVVLTGLLLGEHWSILDDSINQAIIGLGIRDGIRRVIGDPLTNELRIPTRAFHSK